MKLHQRDPLVRSGQMVREFLCDVSLPGARRPLEDHLPLVVEQPLDLLKELGRKAQRIGEARTASRFGCLGAVGWWQACSVPVSVIEEHVDG